MNLQTSILKHRKTHPKANFSLDFIAPIMHDVVKIDIKIVEEIANWLAFTTDIKVVDS